MQCPITLGTAATTSAAAQGPLTLMDIFVYYLRVGTPLNWHLGLVPHSSTPGYTTAAPYSLLNAPQKDKGCRFATIQGAGDRGLDSEERKKRRKKISLLQLISGMIQRPGLEAMLLGISLDRLKLLLEGLG